MAVVAIIGKISLISPIPNADRIVSAKVDCGRTEGAWFGVVKKGQFQVGDTVEVYLQDALVPQTERFSFMEKSKYRVRIQTLRGSRSECLIMENESGLPFGTEIPGIQKYEKPLDVRLAGNAKGDFPRFIPKTDEPNFQKVPDMIEAIQNLPVYISVKADGSSTTAYHNNEQKGVCSRNLELQESETSAQWAVTRKYGILEALERAGNFALQFEIVGEGIQGNPMGLQGHEVRAYNLYDIDNRRYCDYTELLAFCTKNSIPMVDVVRIVTESVWNDSMLIAASHGLYPNGRPREGIVIRPVKEVRMPDGQRLSFKVINPEYKD